MAGISAAVRAAGLLGGAEAGAAGGGMGNILGGLAGNFGDIKKGADDAGKSVGGLSDIFKQLQGGLGKVTPGFDSLLKTMPVLGASLMPVTAGFAGLQKGVELFDQFVASTAKLTNQYVAVFAPAEAELFTDALRDLNAVIGEQLVPVTRAARDVIRFVADAMAGLTPLFRALLENGIEVVRPAFQTLGETFQRLMTLAQPFLQLFGEVFVEVLGFAATQIEHLASAFNGLLESLRQMLGLPEFQMGSSRGKAAASVSFTSASSYLGRAQANAYALGDSSPEVKRLTLLTDIKEYLTKLPGEIAKEWIEKFNNSTVGQALQRVGEARDRAGALAAGANVVGNVLLNQLPRFDQVH